MLDKFNFAEEEAHKKSCYLSGGNLRKLSIASAFIGSSNVIILDEPTNGLDSMSKKKIWSLIR
jgi:ABC-type multidrug transport system ATPase subunit